MLRPVWLLLLLVFSIYSSDLQFHNLLLNCDMPFYFPVVLLMSYMVCFWRSSGNVKITSSLSHLIWVPCSASSFQLCGIYCDWLVEFVVRLCNTQHCHSMRGRSPPPADRHVQVLYPSLLTRLCLALILRAALFFSHSEEVSEAFQEIHIDTWPSDSDVVILITVNVINILFFKHPLWILLSRLPKILGIPSGEFWTERSCHRNKQERFFRQTLDAMETTMCTLGALRLTDTAGPDSCVSS